MPVPSQRVRRTASQRCFRGHTFVLSPKLWPLCLNGLARQHLKIPDMGVNCPKLGQSSVCPGKGAAGFWQ